MDLMGRYKLSDWFTVEKIDGDTWAIGEYKHWEEPHCYLLCGTERAALIDTGLGVANIREVVNRLTALPVLVLTTHAHWDHIGGHGDFDEIAVHAAEADWLSERFPISLETVKKNLMCKPCKFPDGFAIQNYRIFQGSPQKLLEDGDRIDLGNRVLTVVHTPGHSPGHCCFHEAERGYLYSGDLVYGGCLDAFDPSTDPKAFAESVRKIQSLRPRRILPGHHQITVPVEIVGRIRAAFDQLEDEGKLKHGGGIFDYGAFQIHV